MENSSKVHKIGKGGQREFETFCQNYRIVITRVSAVWCAPCKQTEGAFHELASRSNVPNVVKFITVDIDDVCNEHAMTWGTLLGVNAVPMFLIFVDGKKVKDFVGGDVTPVAKHVEQVFSSLRGRTPV